MCQPFRHPALLFAPYPFSHSLFQYPSVPYFRYFLLCPLSASPVPFIPIVLYMTPVLDIRPGVSPLGAMYKVCVVFVNTIDSPILDIDVNGRLSVRGNMAMELMPVCNFTLISSVCV
jgi:hypothetical protein